MYNRSLCISWHTTEEVLIQLVLMPQARQHLLTLITITLVIKKFLQKSTEMTEAIKERKKDRMKHDLWNTTTATLCQLKIILSRLLHK